MAQGRRAPKAPEVSDRERILYALACAAPGSSVPSSDVLASQGPRWELRPPRGGDVVRCLSSVRVPHRWTIGRVVALSEGDPMHGIDVREIGGPAICHVSNEVFHVLVGMPAMVLAEGRQYRFVQRVWAAFRLLGWEGFCILLDVDFPSEASTAARITFRPHALVRRQNEPETYSFELSARPIPSARAIAERVRSEAPWLREEAENQATTEAP